MTIPMARPRSLSCDYCAAIGTKSCGIAEEKPIKKLLKTSRIREFEIAAAIKAAIIRTKSNSRIFLLDTLSPNGIIISKPTA